MNKIVASLVVSCSAGAESGHAVIELDDVLNNDETSFDSGDTIYLRVQHSPEVVLSNVKATHGSVFENGNVSRTEDDELLWLNVDPQDLSYIPAVLTDALWYGNNGAGLRKEGLKQVRLETVNDPALVKLSYSSVFKSFKLIAPTVNLSAFEDSTYPINIVATFEEA